MGPNNSGGFRRRLGEEVSVSSPVLPESVSSRPAGDLPR